MLIVRNTAFQWSQSNREKKNCTFSKSRKFWGNMFVQILEGWSLRKENAKILDTPFSYLAYS